MVLFDGGLALIFFGIWVFCIIDVITTPDDQCRNLPKLLWLLLVIILLDAGSLAWLIAGRPWNTKPADLPYKGNRSRPMAAAPRKASRPDDDEEFLAGLRARAEEQRRRAREAQQGDQPPDDAPAT